MFPQPEWLKSKVSLCKCKDDSQISDVPSALNPGIAFKMARKPNRSFSSCVNPILGIMNVDVRIKMTAALCAITVTLIDSVVPI